MPSMPSTMRVAVVHTPGSPSTLKLETRPIPTPSKGEVLIRIRAFGLNRAEMFTRQGHSPDVTFPRILGIEATGTVASCPGHELSEGTVICTVMGGLGRTRDGSYAEYTVVPASNVKVLKVDPEDVGWTTLGALPEMLQTAWGALFGSLRIEKGERLLVRGGTSSIGLAAAALAKEHGLRVVSTTRREEAVELLKASGAEHVVVDTGSIAEEVKQRFPGGVDKVLELVGTTTLGDSLQAVQKGGVVCAAGITGGRWVIESFSPNGCIPSGVYLTTYSSTVGALMETPIDEVAALLKEGKIRIPVKTYTLDQIVEAHRDMEETSVGAKMVVLLEWGRQCAARNLLRSTVAREDARTK